MNILKTIRLGWIFKGTGGLIIVLVLCQRKGRVQSCISGGCILAKALQDKSLFETGEIRLLYSNTPLTWQKNPTVLLNPNM